MLTNLHVKLYHNLKPMIQSLIRKRLETGIKSSFLMSFLNKIPQIVIFEIFLSFWHLYQDTKIKSLRNINPYVSKQTFNKKWEFAYWNIIKWNFKPLFIKFLWHFLEFGAPVEFLDLPPFPSSYRSWAFHRSGLSSTAQYLVESWYRHSSRSWSQHPIIV